MSNDVYKFDLCTDLLFAIPSLVMMPIYGSFCMGYFNQAGATLNSRKVCVANFRDFHPLVYSTEEELETNLSFEGSVNVTDHFSTTMKLGFCLNFAIICYFITKRMCFDPRNSAKGLLLSLYAATTVQFIWMMIVRFS